MEVKAPLKPWIANRQQRDPPELPKDVCKEHAAYEQKRPDVCGLDVETSSLRHDEPIDVDDVHQDHPKAHHLQPSEVALLNA
jgi:hypothetical protein